jgi:hypothetical protein
MSRQGQWVRVAGEQVMEPASDERQLDELVEPFVPGCASAPTGRRPSGS